MAILTVVVDKMNFKIVTHDDNDNGFYQVGDSDDGDSSGDNEDSHFLTLCPSSSP